MTFKIGDRVRMVQTRNCGIVVGEVALNDQGEERLPVFWNHGFNGGIGSVGAWNPGFLRSADSDPKDDPDVVIVGDAGRRRASVRTDRHGVTLIIPEGFFSGQRNG